MTRTFRMVSLKEAEKLAIKAGFEKVRTNGGHCIYRNAANVTLVLPDPARRGSDNAQLHHKLQHWLTNAGIELR